MTRSDDFGKLILRFALGIMILLHGIAKIKGGVGFIMPMLAAHGIPGEAAYLAYVGEVLAPLLIIFGLFTRVGGWLIVINMLVALWLAHTAQLLQLNSGGGWALELQGMFLFTALALAFMHPGRLSLDAARGR